MVRSPITNAVCKKIKQINSADIINAYKNNLGIEVEYLFNNAPFIELYECPSGYQFYYPFGILGDSKFYEALATFSWYYNPWKWEHAVALKYVNNLKCILEVGCGEGSFLEILNKKNIKTVGLELNEKSAKNAKKKGLNVKIESLELHAKFSKEEKYDAVCLFQILEHINDIDPFLKAAKALTKKDGFIIISVPNRKSFIGLDKLNILDTPPHHAGLWDKSSLLNVGTHYGLKLEANYFEPLQKYHEKWFCSVIENLVARNRIAYFIYRKLFIYKIIRIATPAIAKYIHGHTILVIFKNIQNESA